jgi:hypothetical protein
MTMMNNDVVGNQPNPDADLAGEQLSLSGIDVVSDRPAAMQEAPQTGVESDEKRDGYGEIQGD